MRHKNRKENIKIDSFSRFDQFNVLLKSRLEIILSKQWNLGRM